MNRITREVELLSQMNHENVVRYILFIQQGFVFGLWEGMGGGGVRRVGGLGRGEGMSGETGGKNI